MPKMPGERAIPQKPPEQEEIDLGFSSGIEDEGEAQEAWSAEEMSLGQKLIKEYVEHEPAKHSFTYRASIPDIIDGMWPGAKLADLGDRMKDFMAIYKALKAGVRPGPSAMTPGEFIRVLTLAREAQKQIAGES